MKSVAMDLGGVMRVAEKKQLRLLIHYGLELVETELAEIVVVRLIVDENGDCIVVSPVELELLETILTVLLNIPAVSRHAAVDIEALVLEACVQTAADESLNQELPVALAGERKVT